MWESILHKSCGVLTFIGVMSMCLNAIGRPRPAIPPLPERYLSHWDFDNTNLLSRAWTNSIIHENITLTDSWSEYALSMEGSQPTRFAIPGIDATGHTNITPLAGSIRFWFKPSWTSGEFADAGRQFDGRLFEATSWTANQSVTWWSLRFGTNGESISLFAQNGDPVEMLNTPIEWQADEWHQIALTYSPQGSWLYLDGQLAAQGQAVALAPLAQNQGVFGVCIGSDPTGTSLAQGQFEELTTFSYPLIPIEVFWNFSALAPTAALGAISPEEESARLTYNAAMRVARAGGNQMMLLSSGPPGPGDDGGGGGDDTNSVSSIAAFTGTGLKLTVPSFDGSNFVARVTDGTNGIWYDLFSCTNLSGNSITNSDWIWLGEVTNTQTFTVPGQTFTNTFYVLGTPLDSDGDELSDAFENLVSKTSSSTYSTRGDGISDSTAYYQGRNLFVPGGVPDTNGIINFVIFTPLR